ncbi:MAG: hypothetical protein WD994_05115 [Pseudomonadales bacterium]
MCSFGLFLALLLGNDVHGADACDFLPERPKPVWVDQYVAIDGAYVAVAPAQRQGDAGRMLRLSRQAAIAALAQTIEVEVSDTLTNSETFMTVEGGSTLAQEVESITRTTTNLVLQEVAIEDTWLDRSSCTLWTRVSVGRGKVEKLREKALQDARLDNFRANIEKARDEARTIESRVTSFEFARLTLAQIDFEALAGSDGQRLHEELRTSLRQLDQSLRALELVRERVASMRRRSEALIADATRASLDQARTVLREILSLSPVGTPGTDDGEFAAFRLAEIAGSEGNDCLAISLYDSVSIRSNAADWAQRANQAKSKLSCTGDARITYLWRREFDGRRVDVACAYINGGVGTVWPRPCDEIANHIRAYGANVQIKALDSDDVAKLAIADRPVLDQSSHAIFVLAKGEILERDNQRNPLGKDFRFNGVISTRVYSDGHINATESYAGMGGWNPVSGDMAMEVLGIHVSTRLKSQLLKQMDNALE